MRISIVLLGMGLAVTGCGSTDSGLSKTELAALPVTAVMPTGSAIYDGKYETTAVDSSNGDTFSQNADFDLTANFDAQIVQGTFSNIVTTNVSGSTTEIMTTTGNVVGSGTITGSAFTIPSAMGTLTTVSITSNGVAQPITSPTNSEHINSPISGNFMGDAAQGIYGTGTASGATYTIYGNKQ